MSRNEQAMREDALRRCFQKAAARQCTTGAQVLRQLMEAYVAVLATPGGMARALQIKPENMAAVAVARLRECATQQGGDDRDVEQLAYRQFGWGNG